MDTLALADGRSLDLRITGPGDGDVLVFFHGTPGAAVSAPHLERAATDRGLRLVRWSRPGYGDSTRQPGRSIVDIVDDARQVLAALDVDTCVVGGWSGGGPHALACAARLDAARAVVCGAGVTPFEADGIDFTADMGQDNIDEFAAAATGEDVLRPWLAEAAQGMAGTTLEGLMASMDTLLPPVDRAVLTGEVGASMLASMDEALRTGIDGWLDDDLAFVKPWGFDLSEIDVPVSLWQGDEDLMVPFAHGRWLAAHLPTARVHLLEGEGHISIFVGAIGAILDDVLAAGGPA